MLRNKSKYKKLSIFVLKCCMLIILFDILEYSIVWGTEGKERPINFGYTTDMFYGVNINDAKALTKLLLSKITDKREKIIKSDLNKKSISKLKSEVIFFQDDKLLIEMIKKKKVDVLILSSIEYCKIKDKNLVRPVFTCEGTTGMFEYLLLANANSRISGLQDLKNKKLIYIAKLPALLKKWVQSDINNNEILNFDSYFSSCKEVEKTSQAMLSLLFGQVDASLVDKSGYITNCELNPQFKTKLKVVENSPGFPRAIICFRSDFEDEWLKNEIVKVISNLHNDVDGRQLLKFFNITKMVPYKDEYMKNLEKVMKTVALLENGRNLNPPRNKINQGRKK